MSITLTIVLLAVITFCTRYFFIHPKLPVTLSARMQKLLSYSAPAALTAIWVPIILVKDNQLNIAITSPYLLGALVAIGLAYKTRSVYITVIGGGVVFIFIELLNLN